jgi:hypothetical protein
MTTSSLSLAVAGKLRRAVMAGLCASAALASSTPAEEPAGGEKGGAEAVGRAPGSAAGEQESSMTIESLPPAARQTAREQSRGAVVRGVSQEVDEQGRTVYEVAMKVDGRVRDIIVGANGELLVVEQEVPLGSLPGPVRSAVVKAVGKRKLLLVESVTKAGALVLYEAHVEAGGKTLEIKIDPRGKVLAE